MTEQGGLGDLGVGIRQAMALLEREIAIATRHRCALMSAPRHAQGSGLRLNLGCGPNAREGWVNIDTASDSADLQLDLREPWPFVTGSVAMIYSEHFFEHLEHPVETRHFLLESLRVLAPGGRFSVGVPDTCWPVTAYGAPADAYWSLAKSEWHPPSCHTRMEHLNYHFRQRGEHKYAWDAETLIRVLAAAGFADIAVRDFDPALDSADRRMGTLYADAIRPFQGGA